MPVDPALEPLLALLNSPDVPRLGDGTPQEARERFRFITVGTRRPETLAPVASTEDLTVDGAEGSLPARIYRPDVEGAGTTVPTVVFFHGGGFVLGDIDTHDDHTRLICNEVGAVVLSVDYRLAPESRWPGPVEDAVAATRWAAANIDRLGGDPTRLAVGGDSAGGNLSAVVAQELRNAGGPALAAQLLLYPTVDFGQPYPSQAENGTGYFLTTEDIHWFGENYVVAEGVDAADPRLSPLRGRLEGLPPTVIATAEFDPLRDEGDAYADALSRAGVRTVHHRFDGLIHGFFGLGQASPASDKAIRTICASLRDLLAQ